MNCAYVLIACHQLHLVVTIPKVPDPSQVLTEILQAGGGDASFVRASQAGGALDLNAPQALPSLRGGKGKGSDTAVVEMLAAMNTKLDALARVVEGKSGSKELWA